MNYYERHIGDYLKDTAHLSLLEHGVYTRLMDVYYTREQPFAPGEAMRLVGARTKEERAAVESVLAEFFIDGRQPRCDREIERYRARVEHNQRVGKLGGRPKKVETRTEPEQNPPGYLREPEPNPPSNQTPVTSNNPPTPLPGGFVAFWDAWPKHHRKAAKPQCLRKWATKGCEAMADRVVAAVNAAKRSAEWQKDGGAYIPAPLAWLNQERWEAPLQATETPVVEVWKPEAPMTAEERAAAAEARRMAMTAIRGAA